MQKTLNNYPGQFWLLVSGSLLSSIGGAMVWPFLVIYLKLRLDVPLTTITSLLTLYSLMSIAASFVSGPATDALGRKPSLVISLFAGIIFFFLMSSASTMAGFAALMAFWGFFSPLYSVGANAMIADLITHENRPDAYAIMRVIHNTGVAIGPVLGGILISISYASAFMATAITYGLFGLITLVFIKETLPLKTCQRNSSFKSGSLFPVFHDRIFMGFITGMIINTMASGIMFVLLPVYTHQQYHLTEVQYGWIVTTNALMCVFLQYSVTQFTRKHQDLIVMAVGAIFYAVGIGSVAMGNGFWPFVLSMVIMTIGELTISPTSTALTARLAPDDMRGRYMSVYTLSWPVGAGFGPLFASLLNDHIAPVAIWYGGLCFALISAVIFTRLYQINRPKPQIPQDMTI